ncbi:MAG: hypothetical protein LBM78_00005 [Clostridiales bacterium]|jgi:hypothetical protein|nr:hypothetical protein [Clostridiales bacterium]
MKDERTEDALRRAMERAEADLYAAPYDGVADALRRYLEAKERYFEG